MKATILISEDRGYYLDKMNSNTFTVNALGIFGTLVNDEEEYFQKLQSKYSQFPKDEEVDTFNHLSLVVNSHNVADKLSIYKDILHKLKVHLPLRVDVKDVIITDNEHIALAFDLKQTEHIRKLASDSLSQGIIKTHYVKVVRFVPKHKQSEVMNLLRTIKMLDFDDFVLCVNRVNAASIIYSSKGYKKK